MRRTFFKSRIHRATARGSGIILVDGAEVAGPARRVSA